MNRPPTPTQAIPGSKCPTCRAIVPESTFDGCPVLVKRRKEIADIERLFGLDAVEPVRGEWGGVGE